jgi:hypothetical protein
MVGKVKEGDNYYFLNEVVKLENEIGLFFISLLMVGRGKVGERNKVVKLKSDEVVMNCF